MKKKKTIKYDAIVIGTSAGGLDALSVFLPMLDKNLPVPVLVVQHVSSQSDAFLITYLDKLCALDVTEAGEKETLKAGTIYVAPPDYHLLVEEDHTISLSNDEKVSYSRPSIDVLFETASWVFKARLIGVLLTGANWDGSSGLQKIHEAGAYTIVQDPKDAAVPRMPQAAIDLFKPSAILPLKKIGPAINKLLFQS